MYSEFDNIVARLKAGRIWDFPGGVHPDERKTLSNKKEIGTLPLASRLFVTVKQHIGVEGHVVVSTGDRVLKGQALTNSMNPFAVPVHAPTSGVVVDIRQHVSAHPSGLPELTVEIEPDKYETWVDLKAMKDYQEHPKARVVEAICNAGITGMGGAGFPTHIKAAPKKDVEFLVINGVECEPYITSDDRLMREHAWQIRQGVDVLNHLLSPKQVIIAIEDNKPEAISAMQVACQESEHYMIVPVPTKYPAGGEKQLIQLLTNREVPAQGLPIDVGVIMQNVGTCFAIADAIFSGKPLIQRVVTLTGEALDHPGNFWVPIGTPMSHLMAQGEYHQKRQKHKRIIMGGPMMGFTVTSTDVPVIKATNCILVPDDKEMPVQGTEQPCIRCGACADACPANLLPQQLYWHSKAKELDKAQDYHLFDCIECGACAFECPSEIPLVHYYRKAKAEIRSQEEEKDKADKARERFEARTARLERAQQEREEKHRKAAEARREAMEKKGSDAKDKIAAALARAKAKKETTTEPENQTKNDKVAAAIARAKAKKQAQQAEPVDQTSSNETDSKQDKVAAAVARAKAKKAAQQSDKQDSPDTNKQDKVAAAVARAKAKKLAKQAEQQEQPTQALSEAEPSAPPPEVDTADDSKQDKVARAIARAKAKRMAAKSDQVEQAEEPSQPAPPPTANKEEKIAKAIARAKAKRAAQAKAADETSEDKD